MLDFNCIQRKLDFLEFTYDDEYQLGTFYLRISVRDKKEDKNACNEFDVIYQESETGRVLYFRSPTKIIYFLDKNFINLIPLHTTYTELLQGCSK